MNADSPPPLGGQTPKFVDGALATAVHDRPRPTTSGGESNKAAAIGASVLGGFSNQASVNRQSIPAANTC
jgi:hypothetical protein